MWNRVLDSVGVLDHCWTPNVTCYVTDDTVRFVIAFISDSTSRRYSLFFTMSSDPLMSRLGAVI
jgi:hypothetical protein